jgi:hypothetical protein
MDVGFGALTGKPLALTGARVPALSAFLCSRWICGTVSYWARLHKTGARLTRSFLEIGIMAVLCGVSGCLAESCVLWLCSVQAVRVRMRIKKRLKSESQSGAAGQAWRCGKYLPVTCLEQHIAPSRNITIRQRIGSNTSRVYLRVALWITRGLAKPPIERHT